MYGGLCLVSALTFAQAPTVNEIVSNQNRNIAGILANGVLKVQLELRSGTWRPEANDGPQLFVQAFGEAERATQIPGPLLRMPEGTTVHANVTNKLTMKATVYGLNTRPGDATIGVEIPAGESREFTFIAGAPGTYYYWARTTEPLKGKFRTVVQPLRADAYLNGAFIVDPPGPVVADRIFVIHQCSFRLTLFIPWSKSFPSTGSPTPTRNHWNIRRAKRSAGGSLTQP